MRVYEFQKPVGFRPKIRKLSESSNLESLTLLTRTGDFGRRSMTSFLAMAKLDIIENSDVLGIDYGKWE